MSKTQYLSLLLAAIISGLIGGAGFNGLFAEQKVSAQTASPAVITAQEFRLVDKDGKLRAIFSDNPTFAGETPGLVFYDQNKKARLAVGSFKTSVPTIEFFDKNEISAILLNQDDDRSNFVLKQHSLNQTDNSTERNSSAALWLTKQNNKPGADIIILDDDLKFIWSARKLKGVSNIWDFMTPPK